MRFAQLYPALIRIRRTAFWILFYWVLLEVALQACSLLGLVPGSNVFHAFRSSNYLSHDFLLAVPKPGVCFAVDGTPICHNNLGMRGRDVSEKKPTGTIRIIAMGGSTTYCSNCADGQTWPDVVEAELARMEPHRNFEVLNAGVSGYTSFSNLVYLESRILNLDPDYLVLYNTANDLLRLQQPHFAGDYDGYTTVQRPGPDQSIRYRLYQAFLTYRAASAVKGMVKRALRPSSQPSSPAAPSPRERAMERCRFFIRNIEHIALLARHHGIMLVLVTQPSPYSFLADQPQIWEQICKAGVRPYAGLSPEDIAPLFEYYTEQLRRFCRAHPDILLVDAAERLEGHARRSGMRIMTSTPRSDDGLFIDWIHCSPSGYRLVGESIAPLIHQDLADAASRP